MMSASKLIPIVLIVTVIAFSVRLSDVVVGISNLSSTAYAEEKMTKDDHKDEDAHDKMIADHKDEKAEDPHAKDDHVEEVKGGTPEWRDASDSDLDVGSVKVEMYEDLSQRRKEIEQTAKQLQVREALLKAAEQEVDQKVQELSKLKEEIEGLLNQQSEEEQKHVQRLVKIYEGMKPKDAARIFDTLDLDVLVDVVTRMSERKIAPVMAAMNPERARTITIMMAERKTLPTL